MKVMKAMKLKKKSTPIGTLTQVFLGKRQRTVGGLKAEDLTKNRYGRVVSKRKSTLGKKQFVNIEQWVIACTNARRELGLSGFVAVSKESPLYKRAKELRALA